MTTATRERPIIFSGSMVRAILEGRKTQTRQIVKPQPRPGRYGPTHPTKPSGIIGRVEDQFGDGDYCVWEGIPWTPTCWYRIWPKCPFGGGGSRLWVRETWARRLDEDHLAPKQLRGEWAWYWADPQTCRTGCAGAAGRKRPAISMPRWASRIDLEITDLRVERLQGISEHDAFAEGADGWVTDTRCETARDGFRFGWDTLHKPGARWADNPWVWVVEFRRLP